MSTKRALDRIDMRQRIGGPSNTLTCNAHRLARVDAARVGGRLSLHGNAHGDRSVGRRAASVATLGRGGALMSRPAREVLPAEAALDRIAERKLASTACDGVTGDVVWRAGAVDRLLGQHRLTGT